MFKGFKENILKKKLQKLVSLNQQASSSSTKKIKSVGIITTEEVASKINIVAEIERILEVRNVKIYSFRKFLKTDEVSFKHFTEKDINFSGQFTQTNFKSFLEQPFDLLVGYFSTNNVFLESAVAQSQAEFKVGFSNVNEGLYIIEISENIENIVAFSSELKKYLQILKKL